MSLKSTNPDAREYARLQGERDLDRQEQRQLMRGPIVRGPMPPLSADITPARKARFIQLYLEAAREEQAMSFPKPSFNTSHVLR